MKNIYPKIIFNETLVNIVHPEHLQLIVLVVFGAVD